MTSLAQHGKIDTGGQQVAKRFLDVRFCPQSDRLLRSREMTLSAINDQSAVQQNVACPMDSSAGHCA
jgi:hypothetical protein